MSLFLASSVLFIDLYADHRLKIIESNHIDSICCSYLGHNCRFHVGFHVKGEFSPLSALSLKKEKLQPRARVQLGGGREEGKGGRRALCLMVRKECVQMSLFIRAQKSPCG